MFDLSLLPFELPERFHSVSYKSECYPGAKGMDGLKNGANCQQYAYELLRHFGYFVPDLRSSDLWEDKEHTRKIEALEVFDLVLLNHNNQSWGAHIGIYSGENRILHLSKRIGIPALEALDVMMAREEYRHYIGAKRCKLQF